VADQSAEEAKKYNIERMGELLGTQYSALWQAVAHIHINWQEYVELFGTKPERIELLNRAAPAFFRMIQDELWEAAVLHIARLTDPSKSMGRKEKTNLTIQNLPELIDDTKTKTHVAQLVQAAVKQAEFCRDWRNRRIAHRDLSIALEDSPAIPLAPASRKQLAAALKSITDVLNAVEAHYKDAETRFDLAARHHGALSLLYVLDDGVKADAKRRERIKKGKFSDEDFSARDI
jgi:hypothetical protein